MRSVLFTCNLLICSLLESIEFQSGFIEFQKAFQSRSLDQQFPITALDPPSQEFRINLEVPSGLLALEPHLLTGGDEIPVSPRATIGSGSIFSPSGTASSTSSAAPITQTPETSEPAEVLLFAWCGFSSC